MAEGVLSVYTQLYPDLKEFYAEGLVETGSSVDLPIIHMRQGHAHQGQGPEHSTSQGHIQGLVHSNPLDSWRGQGLKPTAPPPSEPAFDDIYENIDLERLHLDLSRLNLTPDEPELDYTFDIEPDYDMDDTLDRHNSHEKMRKERVERAVRGRPINDLNFSLTNLNLNAAEKTLLRDKNIEVPPSQPPASADKDFNAWMTWRMQANKLLAALILIRSGRRVILRHSEVYRKPLTVQNVHSIVREARGGGSGGGGRGGGGGGGARGVGGRDAQCDQRTSLSGCPYIMYGIPRVKLNKTTPSPAANINKGRSAKR